MNCDEFERRLHRLLDRRLPWETDRRLRRHARACRHCHRTWQAQRDLAVGLETWEPPALADDFAQRVVAQVCPATLVLPAKPIARRPLVWWAGAVMAVAALGALWLLRPTVAPSESAPSPAPKIAAAAPVSAVAAPISLPDPRPPISDLPSDLLSLAPSVVREPFGATWQEWATNLTRRPLEPVDVLGGGLTDRFADGLTDGLRPIAKTLTGALEVLRGTIPIGHEPRSPDGSPDSARILSSPPLPAAV